MNTTIDQRYGEVQSLIGGVTSRFRRRHGGRWDELLTAAEDAWLTADACWRPEAGPYRPWIANCVRWGLIGHVKARVQERKLPVTRGLDLDRQVQKPRFDLDALCREVSDDAAFVLRLVCDPPPVLAKATYGRDEKERHRAVRTELRRFLLAAGWCSLRISETFEEIRGAL